MFWGMNINITEEKNSQGIGVKNIQGGHNGLQTHIVIEIKPRFIQVTCCK